jgi:hypothetical protein
VEEAVGATQVGVGEDRHDLRLELEQRVPDGGGRRRVAAEVPHAEVLGEPVDIPVG